MELKGVVAKSAAGHDKDSFYLVVRDDGEFCYIADGRRRKLEKPKRKNKKHLKPTKTVVDVSSVKTDKQLRGILKAFNNSSEED
ncbi:MAG TPA: hypothetical protein DCP97_02315 [Ruminococcaceae bacterium]|nr:hypothetical protein [Oscillospiraceae bacterium]